MKDYTGLTFNYLTILKELDRKIYPAPKGKKRTVRRRVLCRCVCGSVKEYDLPPVRQGRTKSCGCLRGYLTSSKRSATYKHGLSHGHMWQVWRDMHRRCKDPSRVGYEDYGGRGIFVDPRWDDVKTFHNDMGDPPSDKHTIDRIDNDGPYTPGNCRWATKSVQARNSRRAKMLTFEGRTQPMVAWAEELGVDYSLLQSRLYQGWSVERAFKTPKRVWDNS